MVKLAGLVALSMALAGCDSSTGPDGDPQMIGDVVRAGHGLWSGGPSPFQIHVKTHPEEECGIIFTVDDDTWIGDSRSGVTNRAGVDILSEGARVEVWFGLVLESCPGQSHADSVIRIE